MGTSVFAKSLSAGFMSVAIGPGWTLLTVIPRRPRSRASPFVKPATALGECIDRTADERHALAVGAANVNDPATFAQMPRGFLSRNKQAAHIDSDQLLEIFKRELLNRREDSGARIVHQNINAPECPDGFGNRQPDGFRVGGIGFDRQRLPARGFNRADDFIGLAR